MKMLIFCIGAVLFLGGSLIAQESEVYEGSPELDQDIPYIEDPVGREVARFGIEKTLEGVLQYIHGEWHLAANAVVYDLHMGPAGHDSEDLFEQDEPATVRGFVYRDHISPISIKTSAGDLQYWTEQRHSVWSGGGDGTHRVTIQGERGTNIPLHQRIMERENR